MSVQELIEVLKGYPPELVIAFSKYSEQVLLEASDLEVNELCLPRQDGWVQNKRPGVPTQTYLLFPGN